MSQSRPSPHLEWPKGSSFLKRDLYQKASKSPVQKLQGISAFAGAVRLFFFGASQVKVADLAVGDPGKGLEDLEVGEDLDLDGFLGVELAKHRATLQLVSFWS